MWTLIVEDDPAAVAGFAAHLKREKIKYEHAGTGEDGLHFARLYEFDVILVDLNLPDISGEDFIRRLRLAAIETPILVVSGLTGAPQRSRAFNLGADDFLEKPFDASELLARMRALLRRSRGFAHPILSVGAVRFDQRSQEVSVNGVPVSLTTKERQILEILMLRKGTAVSKESLLVSLYSGQDEPLPKIIDVFVCKLRRKLADAGAPGVIATVWQHGYLFQGGAKGQQAPATVRSELCSDLG